MTLNSPRPKDPHLYLKYSAEIGVFHWKKSLGKARKGNVAGTPTSKGYIAIGVAGQRFLAHRLAWFFVYGEMPPDQIDHGDGDKTNNRICNLRLASNSQNHANIGPSTASTSGIKGVYWWKPGGKWKAQIQVDGLNHFLGYFKTKEEAARAYQKAAKQHFGDFAHSGPPKAGYLP